MPELPLLDLPPFGLPLAPGPFTPRWVPFLLGWLLTYLAHSTLLIALAWIASRLPRIGEETRDLLWKCALVGGIVTATAQTAGSAWLPAAELRLLQPERFEVRVTETGLGTADLGLGVGRSASGVRRAAPPDSVLAEIARIVAERRGATAGAGEGAGALMRVDIGSVPRGDAAGKEVRYVLGTLPPTLRMVPPPPADARVRFVATPARSWPSLLVRLWGAVAFILLFRLAIGHLRLARMLRGRREVHDPSVDASLREIAGPDAARIRVSASDALATPVALSGWEICLPGRALAELPAAEQRGILAHEAAHLVRRDPVWLLAARVIEAALFVQPLNILVRRRLQEASEFLCDEWAVRRTGEPLALARCLASVAGWISPEAAPTLAAAMVERGGSPLVRRVRRILDSPERPRTRRGGAVGLVLAGAAVLVAGTPRVAVGSGPQPDRLFLRVPADGRVVQQRTRAEVLTRRDPSAPSGQRRTVQVLVVER